MAVWTGSSFSARWTPARRIDAALRESTQAKHSDRQVRPSVHRQVGHDLSNHRRKLEPVAGKPRGDRHVWKLRMHVQDEMTVGGQRIDAHHTACSRPSDFRQMATQEVENRKAVQLVKLFSAEDACRVKCMCIGFLFFSFLAKK